MADPFSDQAPGGASKRPTQTIEGTATEISVEDSAAENETAPEAKPHEEPPHIATGEGNSAPPPRARFSRLKSFTTHLAAGALGGLIVSLASLWGLLDLGKESAPPPDIAGLEARIAKLESVSSGPAETLAQLESRVTALEANTKATQPELADLASRIAKLESSLKSLAETAGEGGSVAEAAAISQQIAEAEQRLNDKIAAALAEAEAANAAAIKQVQSEVAELKARVGALAELGAGGGTDPGPELNALAERIAKLEQALPDIASAIGKESADVKAAAVAIAFSNLRAAVNEGRPYASELDTIGALAPALGDLGLLPAYAEKGIPTLHELARSFAAAREGALAATEPAPSGSFFDSLMASAQSLVKIRPLDESPTGEGPGPALARAKAALDKGELAEAVKEVEMLDGAPRAAFSAWLGEAHARLSADETLARIEGLLLVSMSGDSSQQP